MYTYRDIMSSQQERNVDPSLWDMIKHYDSVSPIWNKVSLLGIGIAPMFVAILTIGSIKIGLSMRYSPTPAAEFWLAAIGLTCAMWNARVGYKMARLYRDLIWMVYHRRPVL